MFTWDAFLYMYIGHGIRDGKDLPSIHRPLYIGLCTDSYKADPEKKNVLLQC